jgi:hypothetical protein
MSAQGQNRNTRGEQMFSALPPKPDIAQCGRHVRFVSFAIFCTEIYSTLFNRPVGDGTAVLIRVPEVSSGSAINISSEVIDHGHRPRPHR